MSNNNDNLTQLLDTFCRKQLAIMQAADIPQVTTHLILSTAFFTGAAMYLGKTCQVSKPVYMQAVKKQLMETFKLGEENAGGLLDSSARMYKRYKLIEKTYNLGWQTARNWSKDPQGDQLTLARLLKKYHNLSMSDLSIEGVKEEMPIPSAKKESAPEAPQKTGVEETPRPSRAPLLLLLLMVIIAALLLGLFLPDYLPSPLKEFVQPLKQKIIDSLLHNQV